MTVEVVRPGESLAAVWADIRFFYPTLMRAHMVAHAVLSLEALLANWTRKRFLIRVGQAMAVEMIDVTESLSTSLTGMVLSHWIWVRVCRPPSVDRLVPPQVVVVLELLVADGTDVGHACWPRHRLHRHGFLIEGSSVHS